MLKVGMRELADECIDESGDSVFGSGKDVSDELCFSQGDGGGC